MKFYKVVIIVFVALLLTSCAKRSMPLPDSTFLGTFSHPKADIEGTIRFTIANNGIEITSIQVENLVCKLIYNQGKVYAQFYSISFPAPIPELTLEHLSPTEIANIESTIPIADGRFKLYSGDTTLEGSFTSPTSALGTIKFEPVSNCDTNVIIKWRAETP